MAKIKKAQKGSKLPSGASSASAERDYAKADSLSNVQKKWKGRDYFDYVKKRGVNAKLPSQVADSLRAEGDRKTKATGGVPKKYRLTKEDFKNGGKLKKTVSKKAAPKKATAKKAAKKKK